MSKSYSRKSARSRSSSRGPRNRDERTEKFSKSEKANDPSWYTVSGQLTKDAASLSFNNPTGITYFLDQSTTGFFVDPGVMSILMAPVPGYSDDLSSPLNVAAKNLYSFVRHANSGHANYDSPDLMLMIVAMANAYAYYGWMTRLYGMLRVYSQNNRYLGTNMVKACQIDSDDLLRHIADFRAYINQYALKLSALSVPSNMTIFKRYMWMFSNVFADEDVTKSQFYMYNPAYFYKYEEYSGVGQLTPIPLLTRSTGGVLTTPLTYSDLVTYGDTLIGALIGSEDINIMSGDILKAYGAENVWKLQLIPEEYAIVPVFSEEVLLQIHNTVFAGSGPIETDGSTTLGWGTFTVLQDPTIGPGCLVCKPIVINGGSTQGNQIIDSWKGALDPDEVIVASRNVISGTRQPGGWTLIHGFASDIPMYAQIYKINNSGIPIGDTYYNNDDKSYWNTTFPAAANAVSKLSELSYFNEHPRIMLVEYTNTAPYVNRDASLMIGEMSDFTIIAPQDIDKMHLSAILSMFAVPYLGNLAK